MTEKKHDDPHEPKTHAAAESHTVGSVAGVKVAAGLITEILGTAKDLRQAVADLRNKYAAFKERAAGEKLSAKDEAALGSVMTQVEEELNSSIRFSDPS
jgi:hypothetical protein